jgi:hypothetical protein
MASNCAGVLGGYDVEIIVAVFLLGVIVAGDGVEVGWGVISVVRVVCDDCRASLLCAIARDAEVYCALVVVVLDPVAELGER